jgi:hypothetical protein
MNDCGALLELCWQGKPVVLGETSCPIFTLFITNPKQTGLKIRPGHSDDRQATNPLKYGTTAWFQCCAEEPRELELVQQRSTVRSGTAEIDAEMHKNELPSWSCFTAQNIRELNFYYHHRRITITSLLHSSLVGFQGLRVTDRAHLIHLFFNGATAPSGPGLSHYRGFTITLETHHTR